MSLLRLCAFPRCRTARILFETNLRNTFYSDQCHACVRIRNDCHRRISESPWAAYRRNYSTVIPKKEDGKKRLWEQSHLLDVLEARIQQLQSDVFLDVKHSKKLNREKTSKAKRLLHHQQKNQQNPAKAKGGSGGLHLPGTSMKTISASKLSKPPAKADPPRPGPPRKKDPNQELPKGRTASSSSSSSSSRHAASASASSSRLLLLLLLPRHARSRPKDEEETLAELEELDRQLNEYTSAATGGAGEQLAKDRDCSRYGDAQANVRCFLEACMYIGDVDRAQRCLLSHHHHLSRRKLLTVATYNYMMRVWAKRGALNQIGRLFILVEEAGLKPDLGSYAAALECMGRVPNCSTRVISRCLQQLEEAGFSLEDLFRRCLFRQDERETVLKAVRMVEPDFQPAVRTEPKICTSPLVEEVYTKRDNVDYPKLDFTLAELQEKFSQQLAMEQADTVTIDSVEAMKPVTEQMAKMRALLEQQRSHWRSALLKGLRESKLHLSTSDQKSWRMNLYPYLCLLEDGEYVDIMLQGLSSLPPSGESLLILAKNLGHRIQNKFFIRQKSQSQVVDKLRHVYERYVELLAKDTEKSNVFPRERWAELEAELGSGPSLLSDDTQWPPFLAIQLGIHLVDLMVRELKVHSDVLSPAQERKLVSVLYHMYTFRSNHKVGFIKPHPILTQILTEAVETKLTFPSHLMRSAHGAAQHQALLEGCGEPELHAVLDSLNQLGNCAWKVNRPLLDVIVSIFNGKGCERLDVPPPPSEAPEPPPPRPAPPPETPPTRRPGAA
ncbi:hypothetical protein ANANG_G00092540 [Anguilla anguilla]|uniref:DNA-directed RNA polymerase N-terminal domain-containing protein n=1 Tax=Anguilla anguilla TaxID=7936 RepID=A0A9D3S1P9_ANGAN|nr:hypothetical protein ANANG_G00092540 [Anguilla anguilla]